MYLAAMHNPRNELSESMKLLRPQFGWYYTTLIISDDKCGVHDMVLCSGIAQCT